MFGQRVGIAAGLALAGAVLLLTPGESAAWGRGFYGGGYGYTHISPYGNVSVYGHGGPYFGYRSYNYPYYGYGYGGYGWGGGYGAYYAPTYNNYYPQMYVAPQQPQTVPYVAGYAPSAATTTARLDIQVPPDADVYIEGQKMKQTGPRRSFVSPALEAGQQYVYNIKATWTQNGETVSDEKQVNVQAGDRQSIIFLGNSDKPTPANK